MCVDLITYVIQTAVIAVGNDGLTALFELLQIIYDFTAEEGAAIFQRRLVDDDRCAFGLINNEYLYFYGATLCRMMESEIFCIFPNKKASKTHPPMVNVQ